MSIIKTNRLAVIIDTVIGNYPEKTSQTQIGIVVNRVADPKHVIEDWRGYEHENINYDQKILRDKKNWRISERLISTDLNKELVKGGILEKTIEETPGRGVGQNFYQVKMDYEALYQILKIYYDLQEPESAFLGLRLLKSEYGKKIINMDFVEWITKKIYALFSYEEKNVLLKMFHASPRSIYESLQFITSGFVETYITSQDPPDKKINQLRSQLLLIPVISIGKESLEYGSLGLDSPLNFQYEVSIKFIQRYPEKYKSHFYDLEVKKNIFDEDIIKISLNSMKGKSSQYYMPRITK